MYLRYEFMLTKKTNASIAGLWKLIAFEVMDSNETWSVYPWNAGGTGYLLYDEDGNAALHITPKDYQNYDWPGSKNIDSMDLDKLKATLSTIASNYNYMAHYELDTTEKIVRHTRLSHSRPNDWGKTVERRYEFKGNDTLLLFPVEGKPRRLTWIRQE
jgi:Lipocalin-like domain